MYFAHSKDLMKLQSVQLHPQHGYQMHVGKDKFATLNQYLDLLQKQQETETQFLRQNRVTV